MTSQTCKYDGRIYTVYSCATCDLLMDSLDLMDDVEMIFPEGCVRECMAEYKVDSPEQLLEVTKDKTPQQ